MFRFSAAVLLLISLFILSCKTVKPVHKKNIQTQTVVDSPHIRVDLVLLNGMVYTVDSSHPTAQAFAVKDGKFVAIGTTKFIESHYDGDQLINATNMAVFPGFFDAHCHFYAMGKMMSEADLTSTQSFKAVIDTVVKFSKGKEQGWIIGRGWDQNDWKVQQFPTNDTLNKLFPNTPVYLARVDGHAALVNDAALKLAGITPKTKIKGGIVELKKGKLTGLLVDNAADSVKSVIPKPTGQEMFHYLTEAQRQCFHYGLTTVDDAGLDKNIVDLMDLMQKKGVLKIRIYAMLNPTKENKDWLFNHGGYKTDRLDVRSFKLYADGALGSRGAALRKPYSDRPKETGFLLHDTNYFYQNCKEIFNHGFQVNTHCIGDSANHFMLRVYSTYLPEHNDFRWRIEHAQVISPEDFSKFNLYLIIPSVQPTHATSDMYWAGERLGPVRLKTAYAYQQLIKEAGLVADGSDFPVESVNPLLGFYAAVARKDLKNYPEGGFQIENALTRQQALYGMTIWAAYSNFEEKEKGSIEKSKMADFVILDKDIMQIPIEDVPSTKVYSTYVGGVRVK
jgi:hypothetical protein